MPDLVLSWKDAFSGPRQRLSISRLLRGVMLLALGLMASVIYAQPATAPEEAQRTLVVDGVSDATVFGMGQSVNIRGTVKEGAIAFGGDVIVSGTVEGDVAAIGGSVIQMEGARIGGDVIVVGGTYKHADAQPNRGPASATVMYAGYEQELRNLMQHPSSLLAPRWSPFYLGSRLLSLLFWFLISLAVTAIMPVAVSRGVARLTLTSLRVAIIGFVAAIVVSTGVQACLWLVPTPFSVLAGIMALLTIFAATIFGRVVLYAATGRWLQRQLLPVGRHSEAVALLLGAALWGVLTSVPYVWPLIVAIMVVLSLGLSLTGKWPAVGHPTV
jgi:hypothetical protein